MKISFPDKSYIEISKIENKVVITIVARDSKETLATIANSVELTIDQFNSLIKLDQ